ncbi:MAG: hypothetical protein KAG14_02540 [Mycoplasmataceae bacterium]|nr:hypothetical protein [Mycoplasmataceae bacterium]
MNRESILLNDFDEAIKKSLLKSKETKIFPISLKLNIGDESLIYKNSPIIGSTAFGYILEAYLNAILVEDGGEIKMPNEEDSVTNLSYDIVHLNKEGKNLINIKVEKNTSKNNAIAAYEQYFKDLSKEPLSTRFYVAKFHYSMDIERGDIVIDGYDLYNIDQIFLQGNITSDSRNWSNDFTNPGAGRFQVKNQNKIDINYDPIQIRKKYIEIAIDFKENFKEQLENENNGLSRSKTKDKLNAKINIWHKIEIEFKKMISEVELLDDPS